MAAPAVARFPTQAGRYINHMERLGVGLGLAVALLWGSADILAALAARRLRTFKTTFVSQSIGLLALLAFGTVAFWLWHLPFTLTALVLSTLIGIFTGLCAALGYFEVKWDYL